MKRKFKTKDEKKKIFNNFATYFYLISLPLSFCYFCCYNDVVVADTVFAIRFFIFKPLYSISAVFIYPFCNIILCLSNLFVYFSFLSEIILYLNMLYYIDFVSCCYFLPSNLIAMCKLRCGSIEMLIAPVVGCCWCCCYIISIANDEK